MQKIGIVDLGANSSRLVVYGCEPGKWFRLVDEVREPLRLGQGMTESGDLSPETMTRATATLEMYADYAQAAGLDSLEIIATSAVRDAGNREVLLGRAKELGLEVSLLSGEAEGRLGILAAANGFDFDDAWVVDLGGGSIQVGRMEQRSPVWCSSAPLGAVRMTEKFLKSDPTKASEIERLEAHLVKKLSATVERMKDSSCPIVAMGGTIRNLAKAVQRRGRYPLPLLHGFFLELKAVEELIARMRKMRVRDRRRIPGIHAFRSDVILAGATVYRWLLQQSGRDGLWIAGQGIREGAFYRHYLPEPHLLPSDFSVQNLFERYPQPRHHTRRVRKLAARLFDGLRPLHEMGDREARLLDAAALLHDIGKALSHYDHDRHGAYLINSTPLAGFRHEEQAMIAQMVLYHRRGSPKLGPSSALIKTWSLPQLRALVACLRLAEKLERSRAGRVKDLSVEIRKKSVRLVLDVTEPPQVELWEAQKQALMFQKAFGRKLRLKAMPKVNSSVVSNPSD